NLEWNFVITQWRGIYAKNIPLAAWAGSARICDDSGAGRVGFSDCVRAAGFGFSAAIWAGGRCIGYTERRADFAKPCLLRHQPTAMRPDRGTERTLHAVLH